MAAKNRLRVSSLRSFEMSLNRLSAAIDSTVASSQSLIRLLIFSRASRSAGEGVATRGCSAPVGKNRNGRLISAGRSSER